MTYNYSLVRRSVLLMVTAAGLVAAASGCATAPSPVTAEVVTLEGEVTARGQQPISEYVLETETGNLYVLKFPDRGGVSTPSVMRVTGRLYAAEWDGRPFAHVEVADWEPVQ